MSVEPDTYEATDSGDRSTEVNPWQSAATVDDTVKVDSQPEAQTGDTKRDVKRGVLALVDQAVCSATNFLTTAMVANALSMESFGVFSLAFLCFQFARTMQERALAAPYLVFTHRADQNSRTLLGSNLVHQAVFAVVTLVVIGAAGFAFIGSGGSVEFGYALVALACAIPCLLLRDQLRAVCLAHFRIGVSLAMNLAVAAIQLGGIGYLVYRGQLTIARVMTVLAAACLIPAVVWLVQRPLPFHVVKSQIVGDWKTFWGFSRWLVVARAFGIGGQYLVPAIVAMYLDTASVGAFGTCTALVGLSMMFILGLNNFAQPRIVVSYQERGVAGMLTAVLQTVACFSVCLGGAAIFLYFFGDQLLGRIYGSSYAPYASVAATLSLGMLAVSISIALQNGLAALGNSHGFLYGEISYFVTAVGLSLLVIPRWGLMGAAWSLVAAGAVVSLVTIATLYMLIQKQSRGESSTPLQSLGN